MKRRDRRLSTTAHAEAPPELVAGMIVEIWADDPRDESPAPGFELDDADGSWGGAGGAAFYSTRKNYHDAYYAWIEESGLTDREVTALIKGSWPRSIARSPDGMESLLRRHGFTIADVPQLRRWAMARLGRPV